MKKLTKRLLAAGLSTVMAVGMAGCGSQKAVRLLTALR